MSVLRSKEDGRDQAAAGVLLDALPPIEPNSTVLVIDDRSGGVGRDLTKRRLSITPWSRYALGSQPGTPWPSGGPYDAATLRLPRSKETLTMNLHAAAAHLKPGAPLWVYGANDEGIKSAHRRIAPLFGEVEVVDARRHCRVLAMRRPETIEGLHSSLSAFRRSLQLPLPDGPRDVASYPGVFARGKLDPGTAMLLEALLAHREKKHATAEADHFKNFTEERQRASETSRRHQSTTVFPALHRIIACATS